VALEAGAAKIRSTHLDWVAPSWQSSVPTRFSSAERLSSDHFADAGAIVDDRPWVVGCGAAKGA